jgi:diacylglycerol kinase (ATP)
VTKAVVLGRRRRGRQIGPAVEATRKRLEEAGWSVTSAVVFNKKELRKEAAAAVRAKADVVVAVGGDGAVLQVVNALAGKATALGIVPKGTGNLLASNLRVPTALDQAIGVLLTGRSRRIDLGRVRIGGKKRDFAVACGVGFDAVVMDGTRQAQKRRWGKLAYVATAVREGRRMRDATFEVTIDGTPVSTAAAQVFVANFGRIGTLVEPRRRVIPDDGLLDVIIVRASGPVDGVLAGIEALRQRRLGESDGGRVIRKRGRTVAVSAEPRQLVETDGSIVGQTPITVRVRPDALSVLVPNVGSAAAPRRRPARPRRGAGGARGAGGKR